MTSAPTLPPIVAARYVPIRLIARGGMGAVYEVEHARTGERLALKVLLSGVDSSPDALDRFRREARVSARIKSDHVVRVTDADVAPELGGAPFLVMELLDGIDLERGTAGTRTATATALEWLRQVARAIDKAHRAGVIHRDLKPENLFLVGGQGRAPTVKILDFGVAQISGERSGSGTEPGEILGTPRYMAPEQATAGATITPAVDRFALGLVAYRLLAGESYFQGDVMRILGQLLHEPLVPPSKRHPELGAAFDGWFLKACHRAPGQRFGSAVEQVEALAEALGVARVVELSSAPTLPGEPIEIAPPPRRRLLPGALAAIGLVAALVGLVVHQRRAQPERARTTPGAVGPGTAIMVPAAAMPPPAPPPPPPTARPPPTEPETAVSNRPTGKRRSGSAHRGLGPAAPASNPPAVTDPYSDQK